MIRDCPGASGFVLGSQNSWFEPAAFNTEYHKRLTAIRAEAMARGWGYLPVVEAFRARPDKGASYVKSDGVRPTTSVDAPDPDNGSSLWSRVFFDYMARLKQPVVS